jgi:ArsR family transcriptional regulator
MVKSNLEDFSELEVRLAAIAKALSHPARIRILKILTRRNACICGDIVELLPLAQSTVSQHLKELKKAGLVEGEIEGPRTCYCLNPKILGSARAEFFKLFSTICCR